MRSLERIERITTKLRKIWEKNQDLRFGQLLIDFGIIPDSWAWNVEDDKLEEQLDKIK